ncbi:inner membrane-spanning protein YciB [Ignatzschineria cameli]|uniref:inner membrane-spanning protein YciB n=1 Tax=Ignatzschineria cameli TaxID=2182793 RepID=UPI0013005B15|nr:septation protein IspZ [Ignatzschineria cameli]
MLSKKSNIPQILLGVCTAIFLGAYLFFGRDLVLATKALVYSSAVALLVSGLFFRQSMRRNDWLILSATLIFGTMTIVFDNEVFIQWRTTIVNILIAVGLVGMFYLKKSPIKMIFGKALDIELPEHEWLRTNLWWAAYMLVMAGLNAVIILLGLSSEVWMSFKMVINPLLTFVLAILLMVHLVKKGKQYEAKKRAEVEVEDGQNHRLNEREQSKE